MGAKALQRRTLMCWLAGVAQSRRDSQMQLVGSATSYPTQHLVHYWYTFFVVKECRSVRHG